MEWVDLKIFAKRTQTLLGSSGAVKYWRCLLLSAIQASHSEYLKMLTPAHIQNWRVWDYSLPASQQATCHSFMNAGRRLEIPGQSRRKPYYSPHSRSRNTTIFSSVPPAPMSFGVKQTCWDASLKALWVTWQERNPDLEEPEYFMTGSAHGTPEWCRHLPRNTFLREHKKYQTKVVKDLVC